MGMSHLKLQIPVKDTSINMKTQKENYTII
jgi:hypothetical protein